MGPERQIHGDDDALHPVRRLRREGFGGPGRRAAGPPPAQPSSPPPGLATSTPRSQPAATPTPRPRGRLYALVGVGLAVAASAGVSALIFRGPTLSRQGPIPPGPPAPIVVQSPALTSPAEAIENLRMYSAGVGWAQDLAAGAILHTTEGVLHWTVATPPTAGLLAGVAYVDGDVARALTAPTGVSGRTTLQAWATTDGGRAWAPEGTIAVQAFAPSFLGGFDFADAQHGWYSQLEVGQGIAGTVLYRTTDGGLHWSEVATTPPAGSTWPAGSGVIPGGCANLSATFVDDSTGWITGTCSSGPPAFYVSHDGGVTWGYQPLSPSVATGGETTFPPAFSSATDGTMLLEDIGAGEAPVSGDLFSTRDGGVTWALRSQRPGTPLGVDFVSASDGWLVLDSPNGDAAAPDLYVTGDGGATWSTLGSFPYLGLSLDFVTPSLGWAAPDPPPASGGPWYLLQTGDGGRTWKAEAPAITGTSLTGAGDGNP